MTEFRHVAPGDALWMINGVQTSAFEADVVAVTDTTITVRIPSKDNVMFEFDRTTGTVRGGPVVAASFLAFDDDWRVQIILDRKSHLYWQERVVELAAEYRREPDVENGQALLEAVMAWRGLVENADPVALRAEGVNDYLEMKDAHA